MSLYQVVGEMAWQTDIRSKEKWGKCNVVKYIDDIIMLYCICDLAHTLEIGLHFLFIFSLLLLLHAMKGFERGLHDRENFIVA